MSDNHDHKTIYGAALPERGVLAVTGTDRVAFLQGLVTQDVATLAPGDMRYGLLLTPQGRVLHDFFLHMSKDEDVILLETSANQATPLRKHLTTYKLRSHVALMDCSADFTVFAFWPGASVAGLSGEAPDYWPPAVVPDPRLANLGWRYLARAGEKNVDFQCVVVGGAEYATWRLGLGVVEGDELAPSSLPAEYNLDHLSAISYGKGCYVGQEVTARLHYRALLKRRAFAVRGHDLPPARTELRALHGPVVGEMALSRDGIGIAVLALDFVSSLVAQDSQMERVNPASFAIPLASGSMTLVLHHWQRRLLSVNPLGKN